MIDTTNQKWDLSKGEKYVLVRLEQMGFDIKIVKQYLSKTIVEIQKDGTSDTITLPSDTKGKAPDRMINQFVVNWNMLLSLKALREEAANKEA